VEGIAGGKVPCAHVSIVAGLRRGGRFYARIQSLQL
jgi:hypothetical protein